MNLHQAIEQLEADYHAENVSLGPTIIRCFKIIADIMAEQRVMHCADAIEDLLKERNLMIDPNELRKILREELE